MSLSPLQDATAADVDVGCCPRGAFAELTSEHVVLCDDRTVRDDGPVYGATPGQATRLFWMRYLTFTGRASRAEFWWWYLISFLVSVALEVVRLVMVGGTVDAWLTDYVTGDPTGLSSLPSNLWLVATTIPFIALTTRRLHDIDRSGWWQLVALVPLVGWIRLWVWCARRPHPSGRRFDGSGRLLPT